MPDPEAPFDFKAHEEAAVSAYLKVRDFHEDLASVVRRVVEECLKRRDIRVLSVQARAKDPASFGKKASRPDDRDPTHPKYPRPLEQITDLAGVRIITFFPRTRDEIDQMLSDEFNVIERSDKGAALIEEDRFGYQSIHYLVRLAPPRSRLPEYERFADALTEVQVRTILQHAWAEIEHDIRYKSLSVIPTELRRRFISLAGMLEVADREFQSIQDQDEQLTVEARSKVEDELLKEVEITPDALKTYLDKRLGPDGRIAEFSYNWTARLLKKLGFRTLEEVDTCVRDYDDDKLSRVASGGRQGQTTRFEYMLLAAMGENYLRRHIFAGEPWYGPREREALERIAKSGIPVRDYDPLADQAAESPEPSQPVAIGGSDTSVP